MNNWQIIQKKQSLKNIFTEQPIIGLRRNPNFRQKLVRAELKPSTQPGHNPTPNPNPNQQLTTLTLTLTNN